MSRLECVGSSTVPQKQVAPALLETHMPKEAVGAKYFTAAPRSSLPTQAVSNPMKVTPPGRFNVLCAGGVNNISVGFAGPPVILSQDLKMKDNKKPQQSASAVTGGRVFVQPRAQTTPCSVCVHPPAEPLPPLEPEVEEEHTEEDDDDGEADDDEEEGYRAPLELMAEFWSMNQIIQKPNSSFLLSRRGWRESKRRKAKMMMMLVQTPVMKMTLGVIKTLLRAQTAPPPPPPPHRCQMRKRSRRGDTNHVHPLTFPHSCQSPAHCPV
ncbi:glutamate-rich protein 2 isoform X5 [Oncorhynchus mykiss]|uniref:glutamate-rich protein 2 isoform X5 n=1 Tax=Oncorhynchus mykiss TaxID=8022 RepID=UPI00187754F5|nr:glutamate-rich protein 2 isoform X5 [Oncorhynchus mykiss]